jgi:RND family efflux transporter MFP subunit
MREVGLAYTAEAVIEAVRQSTVAAQVSGRIVDLRFDVGDYVKKGDVIVRIDERAATQALEASEAQVRQAATERGFATIVAPYSGLVSARHVELGEMAVPGKPLMTGFDPATLRVTATVPQAQIGAIQASGKARVEIPSIGKWIEAKRVTIVPAADPRTHTTQVRLELPPDVRGVYPGIYARAHFIVGREPRLLMPRAAVVQRSEVVAAYVLGGDGSLQLRQIRLGAASDENSVEVLAGLRPGERVAIEPLKAAAEAGPRAAN